MFNYYLKILIFNLRNDILVQELDEKLTYIFNVIKIQNIILD